MPIDSNIAGVVRVAYEAQTGEFNREVDQAARNYAQGNEHMSDSAIKLELAQDRLRRSIARGPAASREQQRALLALRQAERELGGQTDRTTRELAQQERQLGRVTRGAVAGSGIFHGLGRSVAFASGTFLGGAGLVYALRSTIAAGREAEASQGRVAVAVRNAGIDYARYRDQIDETIRKQSQLSAFDDEDLADAFAKVVIRTRDVGKALEAVNTITDTARGRQISLEAATQLWIKASLGQAGQLRRVGIEVDKNAKAQELLAKLQQTYAGQAERYGREGIGAQERLGVSVKNTEELLATGLLPAVTDVSNAVSDWLGKSQNQERLQRDVNEAVKTGTSVVKGLAGGLRIVKSVAEPVVDALGGIEKAAQLALIVGIVAKARRAALGFLPLQASSSLTAAKGVRDAGVFGRAWDAATRNRTMVVTTTTTGVPGGPGTQLPGGGGGRPTTRGAGRRSLPDRIGDYGQPRPTPAAPGMPSGNIAGLVIGSLAIGQSGEQQEGALAYDQTTDRFFFVYPNGRLGAQVDDALARKYDPALYARAQSIRRTRRRIPGAPVGTPGGDRPVAGERGTPRTGRVATGGRAGGGAGGGGSGRTQEDFRLDLARAGTDTERLGVLRQHGSYVNRAIAALEADKTLTAKQKQRLIDLYNERDSNDADIQAIVEKRESEAADRRQKAAASRERAAKAREAADLRAERRLSITSPRLKRIRAREIAARATTGDYSDDVTALQDDVKFWQGRLAELKKGTAAYEYVQGEIGKARDKLTAARAKAVQRAVKATEAALPGNTPYANTSKGFAKGGISPSQAAKLTDPAAKGMTPEELGQILIDSMRWQTNMLRDVLSNVAGGNLGTQMLEQLTMTGNLERTRQTQALERIASGGRGPRRELDEAVMAW